MTDPLGQSQVMPYLHGLAAAGHTIWLMSFEKPARYAASGNEIRQQLSRSGIRWIPEKYTAKPPVLSTLNDIRRMRKQAFRLIRHEKIETVHCRSYISALVGLAAKNKFGTRFIFDMRGFWADERVDGNIWSLRNPLFRLIYRFFKKKEKEFLVGADAIISLTGNARDEIRSRPGCFTLPITVIPCCADLDLFSPQYINKEKHTNIRRQLGIPEGAFILSYLGSLGTWYMLPEMLRFFLQLLRHKPDAVFLFISNDHRSFILREALAIDKTFPVERLIVIPASRKEVPLLASLSQASLFFIKPVFSKRASSPTKMGELMGLGIPLICNGGVGDVEAILNDGGNGLVVNEFSDKEYNRVLNRLDALLQADPQDTVDCAHRHYSLEEGVKKYLQVYENLQS